MTEITIIPGKHNCGREMDMRIVEDEKDHKFYIIYGICKKCEMVIVTNIFDHEPKQNVDYIIDYEQALKDNQIDFDTLKKRINKKRK